MPLALGLCETQIGLILKKRLCADDPHIVVESAGGLAAENVPVVHQFAAYVE